MDKPKKPRADGQVTGLAGELFTAAELLKRDIQTSITFGNAKAIDLIAHNPRTGKTFTVQVKSLRKKTYWPIDPKKIGANQIYVFVILNKPGEAVEYYIVPGKVLADEPERFGKWFLDYEKFPSIHPNSLGDFASNWAVFEE